LTKGKIVWFGNEDLTLVNGSADRRRKLLDSAGLQLPATNYGRDLKNYDRALRSRNLLLREGKPRREIEAYDIPLAENGERIMHARAALAATLAPLAAAACDRISGESLSLQYQPGADIPMLEALISSREEEIRLRQTRLGPQRDDLILHLNGIPAGTFASEGQRRTIAIALKLAVAEFLHQETSQPPLLLLDDIFGELDPSRRDALLHGIPAGSQAFLSTTDLSGITLPSGAATQILHQGILTS
jgi:DNA replication and repair protein RecF